MRNSWKVASWELKKNLMNKSFIISIFLTPLIFLAFAVIPNLFSTGDADTEGSLSGAENNIVTIYAIDELQITEEANLLLNQANIPIELVPFDGSEQELNEQVKDQANKGYVKLDQSVLESKEFTFYVGTEQAPHVQQLYHVLSDAIDTRILSDSGATEDAIQFALKPFAYESVPIVSETEEDFLTKLIPGAVAGVILFSIIMTGMMQFQSAVQEKKDKVSEILLSSITAQQLMQGKIIGYFLLGLLQVGVWLTFGIPAASIFFDIPIISYLLNGHFFLLFTYAIGGYLLFSALFVALGATMDDLNTSSNFQGVILMLPFVPFLLIGPIISDPSGLVATIASYVPITTPAVMVLRLSIAEQISVLEVVLTLVTLGVSIWLMMKIAGKIFKTGIMMYGKNATIGEIWKWIKQ